MLVLPHRRKEPIVCTLADGRVIRFVLLNTRPNGDARVAIDAPRDVKIERHDQSGRLVRNGGAS